MESYSIPILILLLGFIIVAGILIRCGFKKLGIPSLIGFILLGFLLRLIDTQKPFLNEQTLDVFELLAQIGLITLLFRVGLESNLKGLIKQIRHASLIWVGNVLFSGVMGVVVAYYLLRLELIPSLFIGVALTATSVGISVSVWQERRAINSPTGELLIDVAEMDDITGIIFMVLLFSAVPVLRGVEGTSLWSSLGHSLGILFLKLVAFGVVCVLFSRYVEKHITKFMCGMKHSPDPMLMIAAFGFIIASLAALLGFSFALGAFFAGLVFSRDPDAVKLDSSFETLYDFFTPFFFIGIGLSMNPQSLTPALGIGLVLLLTAVVGKLIGNAVFSLTVTGWIPSVLISISMVPRAEIAMVVMQRGKELGEWAVPEKTFSAMVMVALATSLLAPLILRKGLKKWPQRSS
ncbi:cation:proton antiporter [bacterium]|nr:cation:proton antiporter [bacterium]